MRIEIFTAAVLLLAAGCDHPAETPKSETPMPVRVLPVTSGNYRPSYEAVAQVKPFRTWWPGSAVFCRNGRSGRGAS